MDADPEGNLARSRACKAFCIADMRHLMTKELGRVGHFEKLKLAEAEAAFF